MWFRRLSGQLVLSHVFVAVAVLAFALGVSQFTFRQYLINSQTTVLTTEAESVAHFMPRVFPQLYVGEVSPILFSVLQGTLNDRLYVYGPPINNHLDTHPYIYNNPSTVPPITVPKDILRQVIRGGHDYQGRLDADVILVGIPFVAGQGSTGPIYGGVFLESALSLSNHTASSLTRLLLWGEIAAAILVGALAYVISWRLSRPLQNLRQVVSQMGRGEETRVRAVEEGPLEVEALAHEFNRLEERIDTQVAQLTREAAARDALMAHVAHDLRTPLTSIRGFLEAIRDGVVSDEAHDRAVEVAWEETLRLQRLVDRLLRATRIRSEGGPMAPLQVSDWVEKTLERVEPVAEKKSVKIRWDGRETGWINGNEDFLMEALVNVVDNAIKWSPEEGTITVDTIRDGDEIMVEVKDEGPGIPEELLPRVFERFVTGDKSRQLSNGLGLSIVDEVMRQHHGSASIASQVGRGTTVTLHLPLIKDESSEL